MEHGRGVRIRCHNRRQVLIAVVYRRAAASDEGDDALAESGDETIQQDGASSHTGKGTEKLNGDKTGGGTIAVAGPQQQRSEIPRIPK